MTNKQLTKNFKLSEFTSVEPNDYQMVLIQVLAESLQNLRDMLQVYAVEGKEVSITITSGLRTQADYERLKAKGYNPSATSDHFFGYQAKSLPTIGAADIKVKNCVLNLKQIAAKIIEWNTWGDVGEAMFGQVIYEYNPATKAEWIHLGNSWNKVFGSTVSDVVSGMRKQYLMSLDNGKTYQDFKA